MGLSQGDGERERQEARGWRWHRQASGGVGGDETASKYSKLIPTINKYVIKPLGLCYYKKMAVMPPRNRKAQCPEGFPIVEHLLADRRLLVSAYRNLYHVANYTFSPS